MKDQIWAMILVASVLTAFSGGYLYNLGVFHQSPQPHDKLFIQIERADGITYLNPINLITDIGENYDRDLLAFQNVTTYNTTTCISLGNATGGVGVADTKLDAEAVSAGFLRANGTVTSGSTGGDFYYNVTKTFTASETTYVNATGLHWSLVSNSDTNMFAAADITGTSFASGDNCTITWQVIINAN